MAYVGFAPGGIARNSHRRSRGNGVVGQSVAHQEAALEQLATPLHEFAFRIQLREIDVGMGIDDPDVGDEGLKLDVRGGIEVSVDAVMCKHSAG